MIIYRSWCPSAKHILVNVLQKNFSFILSSTLWPRTIKPHRHSHLSSSSFSHSGQDVRADWTSFNETQSSIFIPAFSFWKPQKEDKYEWTKLLGYIQYETVSAICLYTPRPRVYLANLFPSICANVCVQQPAVLFISTVRYIRLWKRKAFLFCKETLETREMEDWQGWKTGIESITANTGSSAPPPYTPPPPAGGLPSFLFDRELHL